MKNKTIKFLPIIILFLLLINLPIHKTLAKDASIPTGYLAVETGSNPTSSVLFQNLGTVTTKDKSGVETTEPCINSGNCSVSDIMTVGINLTKFLLGIIGSIALFFFVFSGFKMLTSRGNEQAITSAKQMMTQTIIGILVFLSAFLIVDFVRIGLLKPTVETNTKINQQYNKNWTNTTNQ